MPADLGVSNGADGGRPTVAFTGEVDVTNVDRFSAALAADGSATVVADLTGLTYLDSAGIQVLFTVARQRKLEIVAGPGCLVRRVLEVVGLGEVATLHDEDEPPA